MSKVFKLSFTAALLSATMAAGIGIPSEAVAKPLSRIIRNIGLSPDDFAKMNAAAASLYQTQTPRVGRQVSWSNPETRSKGLVKLAAIRGNCVHLQHFVYVAGDTRPLEIRSRLCQTADGTWVLQP